jgi:hypothetical protein
MFTTLTNGTGKSGLLIESRARFAPRITHHVLFRVGRFLDPHQDMFTSLPIIPEMAMLHTSH